MCHMQVAFLSCVAVVGLTLAAPTPAAAAESPSLRLVRRIHLGEPDDRYSRITGAVQAALKKELLKAGFELVEDRTAADAVLSVKFDGKIELDGDDWDPTYPRPCYSLRLTLAATGEQVWTAEVYLSKGQDAQGEARELAAIAARKLRAAWQKSAQTARHGP